MIISKSSFSILIGALVISLTISSCAGDEETVHEVIVEKTVIESVDSAAIIENDTTVAQLEGEVLGLTKQHNEEKQNVSHLNHQVKGLKTENDSLRTEINQKNRVIKNLATAKQKPITQEELQIRAVIQNLNTAWMELPGSKNNDAFLSLFLPNFAVSMVSIGLDDKAEVKMMIGDEFASFLDEVRKLKGFTLQIGNVDYVYFDGRNDVYSIVYTAILRSYKDEKPVMDRSFAATITLKRADNQWKIGKYSWASMGHKLN